MKQTGVSRKKTGARPNSFQIAWKWASEHPLTFAAVLFALSAAVRLFLSFRTGPVLAVVIPDEIRYLHLAKSIAQGGPIMVRGVPATFQKILYPLLISPAFMLASGPMQQTVIVRVINCLIMSSAVFPVALLGRKITSNKTVVLISMLAACTLPDMVYSATLASEILYLPVLCWMFYAGLCAMSEPALKRKLALSGAFGFTIYLAYLTKEVAAGFLIAAALMLALDSIRDKGAMIKNALAAAAILAVFFAAHFIVKATLFPGVGNSYGAVSGFDQITLSEISSAYDIFYMFYGAGLLLVAVIMSFYALPVFLPLYGYGGMSRANRKLFVFSLISLVVMIGAYAYTVLIREELGSFVPRLSLRYFSPVVVPFMILCFDFLLQGGAAPGAVKPGKPETARGGSTAAEKKPETARGGSLAIGREKLAGEAIRRIFPFIIVVFCVLVLVLAPSGPERDVPIDHYALKSTMPLQGVHFSLAQNEMFRGPGEMRFNALWMLFKLLLISLTATGAWFVVSGKRARALALLLVFIFSVNAYDSTLSYLSTRYDKLYSFTGEGFVPNLNAGADAYTNYTSGSFSAGGMTAAYGFIGSLISVNEYVRGLDGEVLVFVHPDVAPYIDTYLDQTVFHSRYDFLLDLAAESGAHIAISAQPIYDAGNIYVSDTQQRGISRFDYIIVINNDSPFNNTEPVFARDPFVVLRNLEPPMLYLNISGYVKVPME